jgi:hypothetical protein
MTEIDSLTVGVGITSDEFQAGVNKILGSLEGMKGETAGVGASMSESLSGIGSTVASLGLKFAGLFLAVAGMDDVIGYFKRLSVEMSNLAYQSEYFGQSVEQLSRFGEVAKLAGGNVQDALSGVQGLQQSIFGLEFQGQMSQNLLMLQRLGVAYLDTAGHMRNIKDIALDVAKALQQQLPGKANEPMRVQWAATIFGAGGIAEAVGKGLTPLRQWYDKSAREQKDITQKAAEQQRTLQQHLTELSYVVKNEAVKALNSLTPKIDDLVKEMPKLLKDLDAIATDLDDWLHPGKAVDEALSDAAKKPLDLSSPTSAVAHAISWFHQFEMNHLHIGNPALAGMSVPLGVQMRLPEGANLQALEMAHLVAGGDKGDPTWSKAILAYLADTGIPGAPTPKLPSGMPMQPIDFNPALIPMPRLPLSALSTPTAPRPPRPAGSTAANAGRSVTINGGVNISTQAKDANGIATSIGNALERKLLVSQSDPGLA